MSFHERATGVWPLTGESLSALLTHSCSRWWRTLFPLTTDS